MIKYKNFFIGLLIVAFIFQISKFYTFYEDYSDWQYADWLINYQGGFVRRGLIGEILFKIHIFLSINLDIIILFFIIFSYLILTFLLIKSLKFLDNSKIDTLIFFSPGFFIYPIMNSEVIGRKEILLFISLGLIVFFEKKLKDKYLILMIVLIILILSLSHSGLLFYSPYFIFLYFLINLNRNKKINLIKILVFIISLLVIFFLIYLNQGTKTQVFEICESIKNFVKEDCINRGQFLWLYSPLSEHMNINLKFKTNFKNYFFIYFLSLIAVFLFFSLKLKFSRFNTNNRYLNFINPFLIFLLLFILTIPIYILGLDWGRYISMSYFSSYFIYIYLIKEKNLKFEYNNSIIKKNVSKKLFFIFLIFYTLSWTFPFYAANSFKYPLKKPFIQLQKVIN